MCKVMSTLRSTTNSNRKDVPAMLRVLSPAEQSCLTLDAQALIYKYRSKKWLAPQQLELLITEVVTISKMRGLIGDANLVTAVLRNMGNADTGDSINLDTLLKPTDSHLLS